MRTFIKKELNRFITESRLLLETKQNYELAKRILAKDSETDPRNLYYNLKQFYKEDTSKNKNGTPIMAHIYLYFKVHPSYIPVVVNALFEAKELQRISNIERVGESIVITFGLEKKVFNNFEELDKFVIDILAKEKDISIIKNINLDDIYFELYEPNKYENLKILKLKFKNPKIERIYKRLMMYEYGEETSANTIVIPNLNRIHTKPIPTKFMNLGLGKSIYKRLIEEFGYISTGLERQTNMASPEARRVWESLLRGDEYYYFIAPKHPQITLTLARKNMDESVYRKILDFYGDDLTKTNFEVSKVQEPEMVEG